MILKSKISPQRSYPPKSTSIVEESEMPISSSCVAPSDDGVESAKEKDERTILDEPMVVKALELFSPKKVRVKRKN